jgi:Family of unknown function (DUF6350)
MASLLSPRRTRGGISLRATEPNDESGLPSAPEPDAPPVGWPVAAAISGLVAALVGWVLSAGLTVVGWLGAAPDAAAETLSAALSVGTHWWLLGNGAGATLGSLPITLIPFGATALFAVVLARCSAFAARQAHLDEPDQRAQAAVGAAVLATISYLAPVAVVALLMGGPVIAPQALGAVAILLGAALWGSFRAVGYDPSRTWPAWARPIPRAVLGAQLTLLVCGAGVLMVGLISHFARVVAFTKALDAGIAGNIALLFAQLGFVPNAIVWASSYALGAGFSIGTGSVVAPASTQLGLLPGVPLLGALPSAGPGDSVQLWWLAAGVLAGLVAASLVVRSRPAARFDETSLVGGLSGGVAAAVFVALAWASGGDLGLDRLANVGPRLLPLLVMSVTTMGLAGMIGGLALGLVARHGRAATQERAEQTQVLGRTRRRH